jgi:hypothetical protein
VPLTFELRRQSPISTIESLLHDLAELRTAGDVHKFWFRGHPLAALPIVPTIARPWRFAGREKEFSPVEERALLHRFRRRAFPHDPGVRRAGYALFLARHYGLPTRLLDWSANALFALYFACSDHFDRAGELYAFRQRGDGDVLDAFALVELQTEHELFDSVPAGAVKIVHPVFNSPRLIAQEGCFTWHSPPWRPLEQLAGVPFEDGRLDVDVLFHWPIEARAKPVLLRQLSDIGVNQRVTFPDLDGIARSIWETEVLWHGRTIEPHE